MGSDTEEYANFDDGSETETESEDDAIEEVYFRDEEVFLGSVSMEEIRVNKKIGGRRTTIVPRMSMVPQVEEHAQEDIIEGFPNQTKQTNLTYIDQIEQAEEIKSAAVSIEPTEPDSQETCEDKNIVLLNHCQFLVQKVQERQQEYQQKEETKNMLNEFVPFMVNATERRSRIAKASVIAENYCREHIANIQQRQVELNIKNREEKLLQFTKFHCFHIRDKQIQFLHAVILLQSVWRRFEVTKQKKIIQNELNEKQQKEKATLDAVLAIESLIPIFKSRIDESRKNYEWQQAKEVMKQITMKNKQKVLIAQDRYLKKLQAEEKLRIVKERQQKQQKLADEIVPEVIETIKHNSAVIDVDPLKSVDTRLAALRKSRLQWKARLEKATKFTSNMESIDLRFGLATADMQKEQPSNDVNKILQQQQNFLQSVKQKRIAIREKLQQDSKSSVLAPSLEDKENLL